MMMLGGSPLPDDPYDAALMWHAAGFGVVPQKAVDQKRPAGRWKYLQERRLTLQELAARQNAFANGVGFITGAVSGVIVVETDGLAGQTVLDEYEMIHGDIPQTLTVRSGSHRGFHLFFRHPGVRVPTRANPAIKLDVKGDGGYCALAPSVHKSGLRYEIVRDAPIADLPPGLLDFIEAKAKEANQAAKRQAPAGKSNVKSGGAPKSATAEALGNNTAQTRDPPSAETMAAVLRYLTERQVFAARTGITHDADGRIVGVGWIECGMALKAAYCEAGGELWAITHEDDRARTDAQVQWASFATNGQARQITIGTILKAAKDNGFCFPRDNSAAQRPGFVSYGAFTMDEQYGLTRTMKSKSNSESVWISPPFEVLGRSRDPKGRAWGKRLRFKDADGRVHMHDVADAALQGEPAALCASLADEGLNVSRSYQKHLADYLSDVRVDGRVTNVPHTGWHEIGGSYAFVLPARTMTGARDETVALEAAAHGAYDTRGSLQEWKEGVGKLCAGHALPVFMVSAAFAGPLLHLVGAENGGMHIVGPSSIGKSAVLAAGASVWGRGGAPGYVRSWRATANGLEGAAASATDTCLVLDELGLADAREVAAIVYALANGVGKSRAQRDGSMREAKSWRMFALSSGELAIEAKITEDRTAKVRAGQLVRFVDISADRGLGCGAFDHAGVYDDGGKLADALKRSATTHFGTAGPTFVEKLIAAGAAKSADMAGALVDAFMKQVVPVGSSEQVTRVARKFAVIAAAGELATRTQITPWQANEAWAAATWAFTRWMDKRGGAGAHEDRLAIEQVRLIIEQQGEARFEQVDFIGPAIGIRDRLGWRKGSGAGREWWVPPETWKTVMCAGLDATNVARVLEGRGMLRRGDPKHLQCVVTVDNTPRRAYVLTAAILESGP